MDNYKTIESKLAQHQTFTGNSLTARRGSMGHYEVYSYQTCIARWFAGGLPWVDSAKYSVTTSRHQNLIKKAWGI